MFVLQVRNNVAYTIATIGHWDWPEQWPALFDLMMAALQDSNEFAVQVHTRSIFYKRQPVRTYTGFMWISSTLGG